MPSFEVATTLRRNADQLFESLAAGENLRRRGARHSGRPGVHHVAGPRSGEGAMYRVYERLDAGATASYEVTIAECRRASRVAMRSARAYDRIFVLDRIDSETTHVTAIREYPDRPRHLLARMLAAAIESDEVEAEIREELDQVGEPPVPRQRITRIPLRAAAEPVPLERTPA